MPFPIGSLKQFKEKASLQAKSLLPKPFKHCETEPDQSNQRFPAEKVSLLPPFQGRIRGVKASLTVETALVLPIFMFAMISLLWFGEVIRYSDAVAAGLHQTAREMAVKSYALSKAGVSGLGGKAGSVVMSQTYVRGSVGNYLAGKGIREGEISYLSCRIMEDDIIDLTATETIALPYEFLGIGEFRIQDRARVHAFTGYDNTTAGHRGDTEEEIVYITRDGSVYHKNRNCSHLKVTVTSVSAAALEGQRNDSGGKYYPCEYCRKKGTQSVYYLTGYGDRYHTSVSCGALKRDVMAVPLSKAGGRPACRDCGG